MRKTISLITLVVIVFSGCDPSDTELYQQVLDYSLRNDTKVKAVDYISLYINDDALSQRKLSSFEKYLQDKHDKQTYSYMPEEFQGTGPYGKEDLSQEGIYVYLTEINHQGDQTVVLVEKYSTLKDAEPIGLKMTFSKAEKSWQLDEKNIVWKEDPAKE